MERYTTKSAVIRGEYRVSPATTENCIEAINKLGRYEDAEEKGLLEHLPCKVGDTVYELSEGFVEECTVETIFISNYIDNNGVVSYMAELHYEREDYPYVSTEIYFTDIGKTVFLTREDAQQALKARYQNEI